MTTRNLIAAFLFVTCSGLAGCEDGTAARRVEVQNAILDATRSLERSSGQAITSDPERIAAVRSGLQSVVSEISSIDDSDASEGQQAAKAMLNAAALRQLATVNLTEAQAIEAELRSERAVVQSQIDAALRLDALASGRAAVDTGDQELQLARDKAAARARLQVYDAKRDELSEPISSLTDQNDAYSSRLKELRTQADKLYREAAELGPNSGFPSYQLAVQTRSDADQIEARMALNEINLDYDFQAEHDLAAARATQMQQMISSIEASEAGLENMAHEGASEVGATRQAIDGLRAQIDQSMSNVTQRTTDELDGLYDQAMSQLERAAAQSRRAARGDSADAARISAARVQALAGRTALGRAEGLAMHIAVLEQIVATEGLLGDANAYRAQLASTRTRHNEAVEQAVTAYQAAEEVLSQVSGRAGPEAQAFTASVEDMIAVLEGRPTAERDEQPEAPPSGGATSSGPGGGFPSAQALLDHLVQAGADGTADEVITSAMYAETPAGRKLIAFQNQGREMSRPLDEAIERRFGSGASLEHGNAWDKMPFEDARVVDEGSGRASVELGDMSGAALSLIEVDGAWYIDADTMAANPMLEQAMNPELMRVMEGVMNDLAERVDAGEFASEDEVTAAIMTEVMKAMGQMGGGG